MMTTFGSNALNMNNEKNKNRIMKKILYSVFMLATMVLAACSSDDAPEQEPPVKRGMVLKATVEDVNTRATMTDNEGTWTFAFATNDNVKVSNNKVSDYYKFVNNGELFASSDAMQTSAAADWYAYFPSEDIDLANQSGDFADVANKYALAGKTATATTGSEGLTITMKAKAAVLCVVGVNKGEALDICVKTADDKYVAGLAAVENSADFSVKKSDTKVTLLSKSDAGIYYIAVPAGEKIAVYNGDKLLKTTKDAGLMAGKYYTLLTGPTTGTMTATIDGTDVEKSWVQLWAGGPKFATENVASTMTWTDATKTGSDFAWGKNWRTPTLDEVYGEGKLNNDWSTGKAAVGSPSFEFTEKGVGMHLVFTGVQPGYTKNTLTLYCELKGSYYNFDFWTSSVGSNNKGAAFKIMIDEKKNIGMFGEYPGMTDNDKYLVRPIVAE